MVTCDNCGQPLEGHQRRWCSDLCQQAGARAARLAAVFGLTVDDYDDILAAQGGVCGVCGRPPTRQRLAVDHDHRTGLVRGLLCSHCNLRVIGRMTDVRVLRRAVDYLAEPPAEAVIGKRCVPSKRPKKQRRRRTQRRRAA